MSRGEGRPLQFEYAGVARWHVNAGARAIGANAGVVGGAAAAPASYGVIANPRHRKIGAIGGHRQQAALKDQRFRAWAALRLVADVAIGATMELGRSWRTLLMMMLLLRPRGAGELRGHRQQAALKDQRFRDQEFGDSSGFWHAIFAGTKVTCFAKKVFLAKQGKIRKEHGRKMRHPRANSDSNQ